MEFTIFFPKSIVKLIQTSKHANMIFGYVYRQKKNRYE